MEEGGATAMTWLTNALTEVWNIFDSIFTELTSNAYFAVLMAMGLIIPVFKIVRKAKRAALK